MNAPHPHDPANSRYEIRIQGQLDARWSDWFEGFALSITDDETTLTGRVIDQAALHGLLRRVGDLGLTLISVTVLGEQEDRKDTSP